MNRKKILFTVCLLLLSAIMVQAQLNRKIEKAVERSAERAVTRQAERRTEKAVNKAIDDALDGKNNANSNNNKSSNAKTGANNNTPAAGGNQPANAGNQPANAGNAPAGGNNQPANANETPVTSVADVKTAEMAYAKSDFVPGDEIFFDDITANEKLGEFPSQWDLSTGNAEIAMLNGEKCISLIGHTIIVPLMNPSENYLPDEFTIEYDVYGDVSKEDKIACEIRFNDASTSFAIEQIGQWGSKQGSTRTVAGYTNENPQSNYLRGSTFIGRQYFNGKGADMLFRALWVRPDGNNGSQNETISINPNDWHHVSVSFNKRAMKYYIDGNRVINIPNTKKPAYFWIWSEKGNIYIKNLRMAKGAVPLYDRMTSDGKIITYGITFDVGKSTIKPESMTEIMRFVALMKENPDLRFSVEGHTDNTGSAATNQTLSEARSQAVVDKFTENGIARDRLIAAGKGQNSPLTDNSTDEGRAKNRRVEFVKL